MGIIIGDEQGYVVYGTKFQTFEILNKNLKREVRFLSKDWMVVLDMIAGTHLKC